MSSSNIHRTYYTFVWFLALGALLVIVYQRVRRSIRRETIAIHDALSSHDIGA